MLLSIRRAMLVFAAVASTLATVATSQLAFADPSEGQTVGQIAPPIEIPQAVWFSNGFAEIAQAAPDLVGQPLTPELPGDELDSVIQRTSNGLAYWRPGHPVAFTNGNLRAALVGERGLVTWEGDALDPPAPPPPVRSNESVSPGSGYSIKIRLTYYLLSGQMANGHGVHTGAVACSSNIHMGSVVVFRDGERGVCEDTGRLGASGWVDAWGSYGIGLHAKYGDYTTVTVVP